MSSHLSTPSLMTPALPLTESGSSSPRPSNDSSTFSLPPDIVLMIVDEMPKVTAVCLTLTCRALYYGLVPKSLDLSPIEKESLLLLIEKDVPEMYYCRGCGKLHRWDPDWDIASYDWNRDPCMAPRLTLFIGSYDLPFHYARLIITRHLYGPAHGLPTEILDYDDHLLRQSLGVEEQRSWRAKVVNDALLIRTVRRLRQLQGDTEKLRSFFDTVQTRLCWHLYTQEMSGQCDHRKGIPELACGNGTKFVACKGAIRRCDTCETDLEIDVTWCGDQEGWVIRIVAYQSLGECHDASDEQWSVMGGAWSGHGKRDLAKLILRDSWHEEEST